MRTERDSKRRRGKPRQRRGRRARSGPQRRSPLQTGEALTKRATRVGVVQRTETKIGRRTARGGVGKRRSPQRCLQSMVLHHQAQEARIIPPSLPPRPNRRARGHVLDPPPSHHTEGTLALGNQRRTRVNLTKCHQARSHQLYQKLQTRTHTSPGARLRQLGNARSITRGHLLQ